MPSAAWTGCQRASKRSAGRSSQCWGSPGQGPGSARREGGDSRLADASVSQGFGNSILLRYRPPTPYSACVICPSEQLCTVLSSSSNTLPPASATFCSCLRACYQRVLAGDCSLYFFGWTFPFGDASDLLDALVHTRDPEGRLGLQNGSGFSDPEVDRWIEQAGRETNAALRQDAICNGSSRNTAGLAWMLIARHHFAVSSAGRKFLSTQTSVRRSVPAVKAMRFPSGWTLRPYGTRASIFSPRFCGSPPSAEIRQYSNIPFSPATLRAYMMWRESGVHTGTPILAGSCARSSSRGSPPAVGRTISAVVLSTVFASDQTKAKR